MDDQKMLKNFSMSRKLTLNNIKIINLNYKTTKTKKKNQKNQVKAKF